MRSPGSRSAKYKVIASQSINAPVDHEAELRERLTDIHSEITEKKNNMIGMVCVAISVFLLISADALFSYASSTMKISMFQTLLMVNIVQHCLAWLLWFAPSSITRKPSYNSHWYGESECRPLLWLRGVFYFCDDYFYWTGLSLLPLGDAECIYFLCPIFIAFGARFIFKEEFSKTFPIMLFLTAIGVTILTQPKWMTHFFESNNTNPSSSSPSSSSNGSDDYLHPEKINIWGVLSLCIGCICWALQNLTVRSIPKAHWTQLELTSSLQSFALWVPLAITINVALKGTDVDLDNGGKWDFSLYPMLTCIGIGVLSVFAFMFLVTGYQHGEATKVSWLEYMNVPIGFVYQFILFKESPNIYETVGASIMLSTGLIEIGEEYYHYRAAQKKLSAHQLLHGVHGVHGLHGEHGVSGDIVNGKMDDFHSINATGNERSVSSIIPRT